MPQRPRPHQQETESNRAFERALPSRWVDRRLVPDYGLDYTVEIVAEDDRATPFSFHAQLKATDEPDRAKALSPLRFDREWADYYWSLPLPVLIVRYHAPEDRLYARWFHAYNPHVALPKHADAPTKTIGFALSEADAWTDETPRRLEEAVRAFMRFRSPEIALPLRFAVSSSEKDPLPALFALRRVLAPVADLVAVESGTPGPDRPHITLGVSSSTVALADVASVTIDEASGVEREPAVVAADLATALAIALIRVGQANLAARIAGACAAASSVILNYDVVFPLAQAFYRAGRITDALRLADVVGARPDWEGRVPAVVLHTAVLARGRRLSEEEARLAVDVRRRTLERTEASGELTWAAADAYNLGKSLRDVHDDVGAIKAYRHAAELDPAYEDRGYFNGDLAGLLFEMGQYRESAERYARAVELGDDPFDEALLADALLWSGEYAAAYETFGRYLDGRAEPGDAEWRLKHRALRVIRELGGDRQDRDPKHAAALIVSYDFESGVDFAPADALRAYREALQADACCGPAWFRLALVMLVLTDGEDVTGAFEVFLASAVLERTGPGSWNNALRMLRAAGLADDLARDCLRTAYRFCGSDIANELVGAEPDDTADSGLLTLLDEVMREVDDHSRPTRFTVRVPDGTGAMSEFRFVTEVPEGTAETAHDRPQGSGTGGQN